MRTILLIIVMIVSHVAFGQTGYRTKLSRRLEEIKELNHFVNGVVIYDDSTDYGSTFSRWTPNIDYYEGDIVTYKGGLNYEAIVDNRGKNPAKSHEWKLIYGPHPYLFLKDTAQIVDLRSLLKSEHPYTKVYAFAALAHRGETNLFKVIVDNLSDTTQILQYTKDVGSELYPADLMIQHALKDLSQEQKDYLKELIEKKYPYLTESLKLLVRK